MSSPTDSAFRCMTEKLTALQAQESALVREIEKEFLPLKERFDGGETSGDIILDAAYRLAFRWKDVAKYRFILEELNRVLAQYLGQLLIVHSREPDLIFWLGRIQQPLWSLDPSRLALRLHTGGRHIRYSTKKGRASLHEGDIEAVMRGDFFEPQLGMPSDFLQSLLNGHTGEEASKSWLGQNHTCNCPNAVPHLSLGEVNVGNHFTDWAQRGLLIGTDPWEIERMTYPPDPVAAS